MKSLTITAGPSRLLAGLIAGMHVLAAAMFWLVPAFIGSAVYTVRRDGFRTLRHSLISLRLDADSRCVFQTRAGAWHDAVLLGSTFVSPYLAVLNLRQAGCRWAKHLVILQDAVNAEDFRRLRVWLKWRCEG